MASEAPTLDIINPVTKQEIPREQQDLLTLSNLHPVVTKTLLKENLDGFVLHDVVTPEECKYLIETTEKIRYSFWSPNTRKDFRDADTIECTLQQLASCLWERMKPFIEPTMTIDKSHKYFERELEGEWIACGINPNLLFGRYLTDGHFAPHTESYILDGCTVIDFNYRTLCTVLVYLNTCKEGGRTHLMEEAQLHDLKLNEKGVYVGDPKYIIDSVQPIEGSALVFYHAHVHEGESVKSGSMKYFIRTDVLYKRKVPICTSPEDVRAFEMYREARAMDDPMAAMQLFRRAFKLSPTLADIFES